MKTLYRQDGSAVELDDADAEKWLTMGLGTSEPPGTVAAFVSPAVEDVASAWGEV